MRVSHRWVSPALMLLVVGCASPGGVSTSSSSRTLTQAELETTREANLHDAIQRLRPQWLRERMSGLSGARRFAQVYLNGSPRGGIEFLRQISLQDVADVRFLSASDAANRYGTTAGTGGVIEVRTR